MKKQFLLLITTFLLCISTIWAQSAFLKVGDALHWECQNGTVFPNTMSYTINISLDNIELQSDKLEIGAFSYSECRGSIMLQNYPEALSHPYLGFLTIRGYGGEQITFKVYNHETGKEYTAVNNPIIFTANVMNGNSNAPYTIYITKNSPFFSSKLQTLSVTNGRMVPEFSPQTTAYRVYLDCGNSTSELHYTTESEHAEVFVQGELTFVQPGSHSVSIHVEDDEEKEDYVLEFIRPFDQVVIPVWDKVLSVINNPNHNGGYNFSAYQWYSDKEMRSKLTGETSGNLYLESDKNTNPNYTVWLTTSDGISACGCRVEENNASLRSAKVYPNPVKETLTVENYEGENTRIEIYNLKGDLIRKLVSNTVVSTVDVSRMLPGTYIVLVGKESFLILKDK